MPAMSTRRVAFNPGARLQTPSSYTEAPSPSPQPSNLPFNRSFISPFFSYDFEVNAINPRGARFSRSWNIVNAQSQNIILLASKTPL